MIKKNLYAIKIPQSILKLYPKVVMNMENP